MACFALLSMIKSKASATGRWKMPFVVHLTMAATICVERSADDDWKMLNRERKWTKLAYFSNTTSIDAMIFSLSTFFQFKSRKSEARWAIIKGKLLFFVCLLWSVILCKFPVNGVGLCWNFRLFHSVPCWWQQRRWRPCFEFFGFSCCCFLTRQLSWNFHKTDDNKMGRKGETTTGSSRSFWVVFWSLPRRRRRLTAVQPNEASGDEQQLKIWNWTLKRTPHSETSAKCLLHHCSEPARETDEIKIHIFFFFCQVKIFILLLLWET